MNFSKTPAFKPVTIEVVQTPTAYRELIPVSIVMRTALQGGGAATFVFAPYDYDTGTILEDSKKELRVEVSNFVKFCRERPYLSGAVVALAAELGKVVVEDQLREEIQAGKTPELVVALRDIQISLGMREEDLDV